MANDYFEFKQFTVWQDKCAMKIGTDSVLLGSWVRAEGKLRILDIGGGTGILSLMMAQRTSGLIEAVELDKDASVQASSNFKKSGWSERLKCINIAIQDFYKSNSVKYDLIISNPPFFISGERSKVTTRAQARHNDSLQLSELVFIVKSMLHQEGRLAIILPYGMRNEIIKLAISNGMWVSREALIRPNEKNDFVRIMFEFAFIMPSTIKREEITIEEVERHRYHRTFREYTQEFYLD